MHVLEICDRFVVVDANHPRAGQALELDVEVIAIQASDAALDSPEL